MRYVITSVSFLITFFAAAQQITTDSIICRGHRDLPWVTLIAERAVKVNENYHGYNVSDSNLRKGIQLIVRSEMKIKGFLLSKDCEDGDIIEERILGSVANPKNSYIVRRFRKGDTLYIDCVNVEYKGTVHVLSGFVIYIK